MNDYNNSFGYDDTYVRMIFDYSCYLLSRGKRYRPQIDDYVNFNEVSDIQEQYDDKRVMNSALNLLKTDYEENKKMEKLITEQKRNNYKYKDDSAEMDSL